LYRLGYFVFHPSRTPTRPARFDKNARGVRESMAALADIATFCRERGIQFVTFYFSFRRSAGGFASAVFAEVQTVGRNHGFFVADVAPWWAGVDLRSVTNSKIDVHPNERGHEIIAAGMADFLMTRGLVDNSAPAPR
jgi:hypothetical protein